MFLIYIYTKLGFTEIISTMQIYEPYCLVAANTTELHIQNASSQVICDTWVALITKPWKVCVCLHVIFRKWEPLVMKKYISCCKDVKENRAGNKKTQNKEEQCQKRRNKNKRQQGRGSSEKYISTISVSWSFFMTSILLKPSSFTSFNMRGETSCNYSDIICRREMVGSAS